MNYYKPTSFREKIGKISTLFLRLRRAQNKPLESKSVATKVFSVIMVVPNVDRVGGYEMQAQQLSRALADLGHLITVLTDEKEGSKREFRNGFLVRQVDSIALPLLLKHRRSRSAILHVHGICGFSLFAIRIASFFRIPTILKIATKGDVSALFDKAGMKKRMYQTWLRQAHTFVAVSEEISAEIEKAGIEKTRIVAIPNFVNTNFFQKATTEARRNFRSKRNAPPECAVFLFMGRLEKRKGIEVLLRVWSGSSGWKDSGILWIVGSGPEEAQLKTLAQQLKLQNVHFFPTTNDPLSFYRAADVFVLPSFFEGAPNVLLEAMSCGLPVIASRIGGIVDQMKDREQGLLISPGSAEELSTAIEYAAAHPEERKKWGEAAEKKAHEEFDLSRITQRYVDLYSKLLNESRCYNREPA